MRGWIGIALWLLVPLTGWAAPTLNIFWETPDARETLTGFLITYTDPAGTAKQMAVAVSTAAACARLPGVTTQTYCAQWPSCPPPGVLTFTVQAQQGELVSAISDSSVTCRFQADTPCACLAPGEETPPLLPPIATPLPKSPPTVPRSTLPGGPATPRPQQAALPGLGVSTSTAAPT